MSLTFTHSVAESRLKLWALWILLVFVAPETRLINWMYMQPGADVEAVFGDAPRYFAYAQATLGRPYDPFYIRPVEGWLPGAVEPSHGLTAPEQPLTPWRDFSVEYPPAAMLFLLPPALLTDRIDVYFGLFSFEMGVALTLAAMLGVRAAARLRPGSGPDALRLCVLFALAGPFLGVAKYDSAVALALSLFVYGVAAAAPLVAGLGLAFGALVKGAPAILIPIALIHFCETATLRRVAAAAAACALLLGAAGAVYLAIAGAHAFDMFAYHAARPVQIESPYGAAALALRAFGGFEAQIVYSFGSENIQSSFEPVLRAVAEKFVVCALATAIAWRLLYWRKSRDAAQRAERTLAAAVAALVAFIGLGKFFSPQYLVWLMPLAVVAAVVTGNSARNWLIAAVLATQAEFPFFYHIPQLLPPVALIRDALLLGTAALLIGGASARRREQPLGEPASSPAA